MKKTAIIFLSLLFLIVIVNAQNAALRVSRVNPIGDTSDESEYSSITVSFNQDIVPLGFNENITNEYLSFNIPITGKYRFIDSRTLTFKPDKVLPNATRIEIVVKAGIKSLVTDTALNTDYKWAFNTKRPTLIKSSPYNNRSDVAMRDSVVLYFSLDMNLDAAKNKIKIIDSESGREINYSLRYATTNDIREWEVDEYSLEQILVVTPNEDYGKNKKINIVMEAGLKSLVGDLGLSKNQTVSFTTHKEFAIISTNSQEVTADYENGAPKIEFSTAVKYSELYKNIEITPSINMPEIDEEEDNDYSRKTFNLYNISFKPRNTYTIKVKKGIKDIYGQVLNNDFTMTLEVNDYNARFSMPSGIGIVEAYEGRKLPVNIMNPNDVMVSSKVIGKNDIIPYLILSDAVYSETAKKTYRSRNNLLQYDKTDEVNLDYVLNQYSISALYLDNYLGGAKYGLLSLEASTEVGADLRVRTNKSYVQVTDMGITGKFAGDSNTIFITDLKTGTGISDVDIEIRDDLNNILYKTKTDKDGIATTPGSTELGIAKQSQWERPRQWVIASKGEDIAFIHSQWGSGVSPWRMNVDYQYDNNYVSYQEDGEYKYTTTERNVKSYMFTERGIYKPGESVHIKGVVREVSKGNWSIARDISNVSYTITDSRGKEILKGSATVNEFGSYFIDTTLLKNSPTGYYSVSATDKNTFSSYLNFRVDVFKALEFETRIWSEDKDYVLGDDLNAKVSGWYLFGEFMKNNALNYNISLSETTFTPPNNAGFRFSPLAWYEDEYYYNYYNNIESAQAKLNESGEYAIKTKVDSSRNIQAANITLEATIRGEDSQSVSSSKTLLFHGADYYLGIRKAGYFVEQKKPTELQVIAVDYKGNKLENKRVELKVIHREWKSVKKAITGGRFQWESVKVDTIVDTKNIETKNESVVYSFTPEKSGLYFVEIASKDSKNREIKSAEYMYVIGNDYAPWAMFDDDLLELIAEKESYEAGETARIMVKNPYETATALITVEREFVMDRYITNIKGSSALIEVPIKKEYLPNVYIGVALVKGRVEDASYTNYGSDEGRPSFKIGYASLDVSPKEKELDVKITKSHSEIEPGKPITVDIEVKNKNDKPVEGEVMFSVVDVGVLNLINFKTPNWFNSFYGKRPLSVATSDSRLHIIGQRNYGEKGETPGGDSEARMAMSKSAMADEFSIRKNFLSTAYYKGNVKTDKNGKATITFDMPDNLTSFRIMASAIDKNGQFGAGEDIIVVKQNLMLMSTMPHFTMIEDKFTAGATLYNYSSKDLEVSVMATVSNAKLKQDVQTVKVAKGENVDVRFDIETDNLGEVEVLLFAKGEEYSDALQVKFEVKQPITTELFALHTSTDSNKINVPLAIPSRNDIYKNSGSINVYLSPSAFSESRTALNYLFEYPYGCLEQQLSKVLPIVNSKRVMIDMGLVNKTEEELDNVVREVLENMKDFQNSDGSFSYYKSKTWSSPWLSAYALEFLFAAIDSGYEVDEEMGILAREYLYNYLNNKVPKPRYYSDEYINLSSYAYALSVLASSGSYDRKLIDSVIAKVDTLPFYGRVYLLKAMHYAGYKDIEMKRVKNLVLNSLKEDSNTAHYELENMYRNLYWIHSSSVRDTALALTTLMEVGADNDRLNEKLLRYLIQQKNSKLYLNTQENIAIYNAMNKYFVKYESVYPSFRAEFTMAGKSILEASFNGRRGNIVNSENSFDSLGLYKNNAKSGGSLELTKKGKGRVYYGVTLKYSPKDLAPKKDNGITVTRSIIDQNGKTLDLTKDSLVQGEDYIVEVKIKTEFERSFVIVDSGIAGGLRIQNSSFASTSSKIKELENVAGGSSFIEREIYEDRVLFFNYFLPRGEYTERYVVRASTPGEYLLQSTKAEEMYNPEVYGYDGQVNIKVIAK